MNRKKILIIAIDPWRDDSNGGNVFTNLFSGWGNEYEFAQIYFRSTLPNNSICNRYYQLSETEMVKSVWTFKAIGKELKDLDLSSFVYAEDRDAFKNPLLSWLKNKHLSITKTATEFLWLMARWKTDSLNDFIDSFNPDYIFAPLNNSPFKLRVDRYIARRTGKHIISYISDDHLSFKPRSCSLFFWINRISIRYAAKKTAKYCSLLYTMTDEQLAEYTDLLKVPMKILRKGCIFDHYTESIQKKPPYTIVYGGNLLYGRISTLKHLALAISEINRDNGQLFILKIFTSTKLSNKDLQILNDGQNSTVYGRVTQQQLNEAYHNASIALHVDSLSTKARLISRLSFSTKIVDLLHTGCCVMAICWNKSSAYKYLFNEQAAICIDSIDGIQRTLIAIANNQQLLHEYSRKAWACGTRNHNIKEIQENLKRDFDEHYQ